MRYFTIFLFSIISVSICRAEAQAPVERVLGQFHLPHLEQEVSKWWGLDGGTLKVVKVESGELSLKDVYARVREDMPAVGAVAEGVIESARQYGRDVCANMGANFNIAACKGEKNYIFFSGLPGYSTDTRVVCTTRTVLKKEPSLKISDCAIITPRGEGHSRVAFQAHNKNYSAARAMEFPKSFLDREPIVAPPTVPNERLSLDPTVNSELVGPDMTIQNGTTISERPSPPAHDQKPLGAVIPAKDLKRGDIVMLRNPTWVELTRGACNGNGCDDAGETCAVGGSEQMYSDDQGRGRRHRRGYDLDDPPIMVKAEFMRTEGNNLVFKGLPTDAKSYGTACAMTAEFRVSKAQYLEMVSSPRSP